MHAPLPVPLVLVHVTGATVGLISGYLSMLLRKGSSMHRIAGNIFVVSMLVMGTTGAYIATFLRPNAGNFAGGMLTVYLVSTGWMAGRRREQAVRAFDLAAFALIAALGGTFMSWGVQAKLTPKGVLDGYPAGMFFTFGTIALLFAAGDARMMLRGGVAGARRVARHLWRMCLALLFATLSFYPGNRNRFFTDVPRTALLYLPHILLAASTVYWMIRIRMRRRTVAAAAEIRDHVAVPAESRAA